MKIISYIYLIVELPFCILVWFIILFIMIAISINLIVHDLLKNSAIMLKK